jgi:hypothetical protein
MPRASAGPGSGPRPLARAPCWSPCARQGPRAGNQLAQVDRLGRSLSEFRHHPSCRDHPYRKQHPAWRRARRLRSRSRSVEAPPSQVPEIAPTCARHPTDRYQSGPPVMSAHTSLGIAPPVRQVRSRHSFIRTYERHPIGSLASRAAAPRYRRYSPGRPPRTDRLARRSGRSGG